METDEVIRACVKAGFKHVSTGLLTTTFTPISVLKELLTTVEKEAHEIGYWKGYDKGYEEALYDREVSASMRGDRDVT